MKNRRVAPRTPIKLLVNCLPPGASQRNGHPLRGVEMWVHDIGHDGVGLHWSRQWAFQLCPDCSHTKKDKTCDSEQKCLCNQEPRTLKKGQKVKLDGLFYTDKGSKPFKGKIRWIRPDKKGDISVGILVTSPQHRLYFKELEAISKSR